MRTDFPQTRRKLLVIAIVPIVVLAIVLAATQTGAPKDPSAEAPSENTVPASEVTAWTGDLETGDFNQWSAVEEATPSRARVVPSPVREGKFAARIELRAGDSVSGGTRTELATYGEREFQEGDEAWFSWSTRFARDFPAPDQWAIFTQWKQDGEGSPPVAMAVRKNSVYLQMGPDDGYEAWYMGKPLPIARGKWHDWRVRIRFSKYRTQGEVEVWHNGKRYVSRPARTLTASKSYLKLGYYRSSGIRQPGVIWHDGMRIEPVD